MLRIGVFLMIWKAVEASFDGYSNAYKNYQWPVQIHSAIEESNGRGEWLSVFGGTYD
jgi:hypothetical protein